ncbi:MAG: hypothetical protein M3O03_09190 [Pseudomonadota bacterium]|nr:hypothetical protein [Pseudomonadota bacterium]
MPAPVQAHRTFKLSAPPLLYECGRHPHGTLTEIANMLGRNGIDPEDLPGHLGTVWSSIQTAIEEPQHHAFRPMNHFGVVDEEVLKRFNLTKGPRISVRAYLTSKGNLSVIWETGHQDLLGVPLDCPEWRWVRTVTAIFDRPTNELFFVRQAEDLKHARNVSDPLRHWLASALIFAMHGAVSWIIEILKSRFDVQVLEYIKVEAVPPEEMGFEKRKMQFGGPDRIAAGFEIGNKLADELARLVSVIDGMKVTHKICAEDFCVKTSENVDEKGNFNFEVATRKLRKTGWPTIKPSMVRDLRADMETALAARLWSPPDRVVSLQPGSPANSNRT